MNFFVVDRFTTSVIYKIFGFPLYANVFVVLADKIITWNLLSF